MNHDRVFNHFRLWQVLVRKNRGRQLTVAFQRKSLCVKAWMFYDYELFKFQVSLPFPSLYLVTWCHLSISAFSGAMLKLRISQVVAQLPSSCWPPTGKKITSTFCWAKSGRAKLEQSYARPRTAYLQLSHRKPSVHTVGRWMWRMNNRAGYLLTDPLSKACEKDLSVCSLWETNAEGPLKIVWQNMAEP